MYRNFWTISISIPSRSSRVAARNAPKAPIRTETFAFGSVTTDWTGGTNSIGPTRGLTLKQNTKYDFQGRVIILFLKIQIVAN